MALFFLFFLMRFPFGEVKIWAISSAARAAQLDISLRDSSFLLPLGLELEDLIIVQKSGVFVTPKIDALGIKINPFSLIGNRKELSFYITNGGRGSGSITLEKNRAIISIESKLIHIGGLEFEKEASVERGKVSISGDMTLSNDYREGEGSLHVGGSDLMLRNISPFAPALSLKEFSAKVEKKGATVNITSLSLDMEGLLFKGSGSVNLAKPFEKSALDLGGKVDLSNGSSGSLSAIVSMIRGITGGGDTFNLRLSGNINRPDVKINDKKLF